MTSNIDRQFVVTMPNSRSHYNEESQGESMGECVFRQAMNQCLPVVKLISVVVCGDDVQQEDVFGLRIQTGDAELHLWEHLSANWNF